MLEEVFTAPKPGLVDRFDNGAHSDMDVRTFLLSTASITPFLREMAELGYHYEGSAEKLFPLLRRSGGAAEQAMFRATGGVNTHKGAIFTLGLLSASAGRLRRSTAQLNAAEILSEAQKIAAPSMKAEFTLMRQLSKDSPELSHGERLFLLHGECGIRGEAAEGFPILTRHAIPALRTALNAGLSPDAARLDTLLHILLYLNDTNILSRGSHRDLLWLREESRRILSLGGASSEAGMRALKQLNRDCIRKKLSPGGAADILAAALFLCALEHI